jgi:hypothetical protein
MKPGTMPVINTGETASVSSHPYRKKSPPSKVVVAESDLDHVLQAIDNVMESEKIQATAASAAAEETTEADQQTNMAEIEDNEESRVEAASQRTEDDEEPRDHQGEVTNAQAAFLDEIQKSLKERLHQIVQPIPDEQYHQRVRQPYIQQQIDDEEDAERRLSEGDDAKIKAEDDAQRQKEKRKAKEVNNDHDDHELLDQEALKRARELRQKLREIATQRLQQQTRILERAIHLANLEVLFITEDIKSQQRQQQQYDKDDNEEKAKARQAVIDKRQDILRQYEISLQRLTESLSQTVGRYLPTNLRDICDTIANIDQSLQKQSQPGTLSQTEQAIVSRDNEGRILRVEENDFSPIEEDEECIDKSAPEFLLATFLSNY